jgi:hypothetical protein
VNNSVHPSQNGYHQENRKQTTSAVEHVGEKDLDTLLVGI